MLWKQLETTVEAERDNTFSWILILKLQNTTWATSRPKLQRPLTASLSWGCQLEKAIIRPLMTSYSGQIHPVTVSEDLFAMEQKVSKASQSFHLTCTRCFSLLGNIKHKLRTPTLLQFQLLFHFMLSDILWECFLYVYSGVHRRRRFSVGSPSPGCHPLQLFFLFFCFLQFWYPNAVWIQWGHLKPFLEYQFCFACLFV